MSTGRWTGKQNVVYVQDGAKAGPQLLVWRVIQLINNKTRINCVLGTVSGLQKDTLAHATAGRELEDIRLDERSQAQRGRYLKILLLRGPWSSQIQRQKVGWWSPRSGAGGWESVFPGDRVCFSLGW